MGGSLAIAEMRGGLTRRLFMNGRVEYEDMNKMKANCIRTEKDTAKQLRDDLESYFTFLSNQWRKITHSNPSLSARQVQDLVWQNWAAKRTEEGRQQRKVMKERQHKMQKFQGLGLKRPENEFSLEE